MKHSTKHIVIITGQHMVSNPRVWKEANTLASNAYKVTILTTFYDAYKKEQDIKLLHPEITYKGVVNLIKNEGHFINGFIYKGIKKIALSLKKLINIDSNWLLVYHPAKQIRLAIKENADLYIAHQETGLIIGNGLLKNGKRVAFDIEDWYSRDYLNRERPIKLLKILEAYAIQNAEYCTCPSYSMSQALINTYQSKKELEIIYNGFSINENKSKKLEHRIKYSLVWFSQVIGPERGLETLMKALNFVSKPLEIHLVGVYTENYALSLKNLLAETRHILFFHSSMKHYELLPFLSRFNIGLALENKTPDSRDTTITNKILQYLQAGNKIIATNTKGQIELASQFTQNISIVDVNQPEQWASSIEQMLENTNNFEIEQFIAFCKKFSWEAQEEKLLNLVKNCTNY